jgi:hypothetical protein
MCDEADACQTPRARLLRLLESLLDQPVADRVVRRPQGGVERRIVRLALPNHAADVEHADERVREVILADLDVAKILDPSSDIGILAFGEVGDRATPCPLCARRHSDI